MNLYVYIHTCKCFISCNVFSNFVIQCHLVFVNKNNTVLRNACFWLVNKHKGFCVFVGLKWKNDWLLKRDGDCWNGWDTFWYHCKIVWHERHITDEGERTISQILKLCQRSWRLCRHSVGVQGFALQSRVESQHPCGVHQGSISSQGPAFLWWMLGMHWQSRASTTVGSKTGGHSSQGPAQTPSTGLQHPSFDHCRI